MGVTTAEKRKFVFPFLNNIKLQVSTRHLNSIKQESVHSVVQI